MIYRTQETRRAPAPFVASFSSRGPSPGTQRLLKVRILPFHNLFLFSWPPHTNLGVKNWTSFLYAVIQPDIVAPGVNILAAYTPIKSITGLKGDTQYSKFTIMSGTSMSCPHTAGVAAYVKSFHPNWSPAAVKSAILTTGKMNRLIVVKESTIVDVVYCLLI